MEARLTKISLQLWIIFISLVRVQNVKLIKQPIKSQCDQVQLENQWYRKQILLKKLGRPHNLAFHKPSQSLLFVYSVSNYHADVDFQIADYNLITKETFKVEDVIGGCAIAIDEQTDNVYFGGDDGIYKYNIHIKKSIPYRAKGVNIWGLSFQKNLFYIKYPEQRLHVEVNGKFSVIKDFDGIEVDHFHVTASNDIYTANKSGIFRFNYETKANLRIIVATARQITENHKGEVYFSTNKGLFKSAASGRKKISNAEYIYGLAFTTTSNIIITDDSSIILLIPTNKQCKEAKQHKPATTQKTKINKKKKVRQNPPAEQKRPNRQNAIIPVAATQVVKY